MKDHRSWIPGLVIVAAWFLLWLVPAEAQPDPLAQETLTPSPTPYLVRTVIMGVFSDYSIRPITSVPPTDTPSPTASPTPTDTPSPTPTTTPTPGVTIEPTQEHQPTPTPVPPVTETPEPEKVCRLKNGQYNINIRADHNTNASKVGLWDAKQDAVFDLFAVEQDYLWGHQQDTGWNVVAIYYEDPLYVSWWVYGIEQGTDLCTDVLGWPDGLLPPSPTMRKLDGFHLIVGAVQTLLAYVEHIGSIKGTTSAEQIPLMAAQIDPDIVTIFRSLYNAHGQQDCPSEYEWYHPEEYFDALRPFWPSGFVFYEFVNECGPPDSKVEADFNIAMLDLMAQNGYCGLAFSPGPGNPKLHAWDDWVHTLKYINSHPCGTWPDGSLKYHGLAVHQAGKFPDWVETLPGNYSKNPWIYDRLRLVNDYLVEYHQFSLHDFKGPIYITELGWEDYTIPNESFTCEEVRAGLDDTREMLLAEGFVDGFEIWNFRGPDGFWWVDLTPCLRTMYQ